MKPEQITARQFEEAQSSLFRELFEVFSNQSVHLEVCEGISDDNDHSIIGVERKWPNYECPNTAALYSWDEETGLYWMHNPKNLSTTYLKFADLQSAREYAMSLIEIARV